MDIKSLTVPEMAKTLRIGLNRAYELVKTPGFPAIRISARRIIIPIAALERWLAENAEA